MKTTLVRNIATNEVTVFVNDLSLSENIVNLIICESKRTGQILDDKVRQEIKEKYPIKEAVSTITGKQFAYCEAKDLHAKYV